MALFGWFKKPEPAPPLTNRGTGHHYICECNACIDAFMEHHNYEQYTSKGLPIPTWEEMMASQREYDRLVDKLGGAPPDRASMGAFEMHKRIMRIMNGEEAEPA